MSNDIHDKFDLDVPFQDEEDTGDAPLIDVDFLDEEPTWPLSVTSDADNAEDLITNPSWASNR